MMATQRMYLLIENKFSADLSEDQPVPYLKRLAGHSDSAIQPCPENRLPVFLASRTPTSVRQRSLPLGDRALSDGSPAS